MIAYLDLWNEARHSYEHAWHNFNYKYIILFYLIQNISFF